MMHSAGTASIMREYLRVWLPVPAVQRGGDADDMFSQACHNNFLHLLLPIAVADDNLGNIGSPFKIFRDIRKPAPDRPMRL